MKLPFPTATPARTQRRAHGARALAAAWLGAAPLLAAAAPTYEFGGRLQLQHDRFDGLYSRDGGSESESYLRRATAELSGRLHADWRYELELQVDDRFSPTWRTAAISYTGLKAIRLSAGRMKPDFGLEESTSSKWSTGIERSAIWDLAPDAVERSNGIALRHAGARHSLALGGYRRSDHDALVARATYAPNWIAGGVTHLGVSLADERIDRSDGQIRSRLGVQGVSESRAGNRSTLAPTGLVNAYDSDRSWVLEFAQVQGPWSLQAEWLQRRLGADAAARDRAADGFYVQLAWTLTGETRPYDIEGGKFGGIRPANARWGAWELLYRHDRLELRGAADMAGDPDRVSARVHVVGVNWYATRALKLSLNALSARTDRPDNEVGSRDGDALSLRLQWLL